MDKKGFLLAEETLKIIIAVIAISFLIYFLTSIYLKHKESKNLELAKASLEHLIEEIKLEHTSVEIYNPTDWIISSWPRETIKSWKFYSIKIYSTKIKDDIPKFCSNLNWKTCLCICKDNIHFEGADCDENGICVKSDYIIKGDPIKIENPPIKLKIDNNNKKIA